MIAFWIHLFQQVSPGMWGLSTYSLHFGIFWKVFNDTYFISVTLEFYFVSSGLLSDESKS